MNSLGKVDLQPPEDLNTGDKQLEVATDAQRFILTNGLVFPVAPAHYPGEMPENITQLDDSQLGDLLNRQSNWCSFVDTELAKADANLAEAKARLDFIRSRVRIMLKVDGDQKKLTNSDKDDLVNTDPRVVSSTSRALFCDAVYSLTRAIRERAQRNWETISRRITQRGQEIERMKRESNVGQAPLQHGRAFRSR